MLLFVGFSCWFVSFPSSHLDDVAADVAAVVLVVVICFFNG